MPDLANRLSAVLRLDWGSSFWILGADLESSGGKPCWEDLPPLHDHAGLKIPHHGSKGAHSARWADSDGVRQPRLWALTPFNGASLPRFDEPSGLPTLLGRQSPILVTSLPSAYLKTIQGRTLQCSEVHGWRGLAVLNVLLDVHRDAPLGPSKLVKHLMEAPKPATLARR